MTERMRAAARMLPRQLTMSFDAVRLHGLSPDERASVVTVLATLLLEAADAGTGGTDERS